MKKHIIGLSLIPACTKELFYTRSSLLTPIACNKLLPERDNGVGTGLMDG